MSVKITCTIPRMGNKSSVFDINVRSDIINTINLTDIRNEEKSTVESTGHQKTMMTGTLRMAKTKTYNYGKRNDV